jgi:hypothetical protein
LSLETVAALDVVLSMSITSRCQPFRPRIELRPVT